MRGIELEPTVEDLRRCVRNNGYVRSSFWTPGIAPIFPQLIHDFHSDFAGVVNFTEVTILVLGFRNFLW